MSFANTIVSKTPNKYETILQNKILSAKLKLKVNQYNSIQTSYDNLIRKQLYNKRPSSGGWKHIPGKLHQISASGKNWLWGISTNDKIVTCKKPCDDGNWINIPGSLKQLVGGETDVWGVNSSNNIYKMNQNHNNNWIHVGGKLMNISQGGGWIWGVNSEHKVYRCKYPCDGGWILVNDSIPENNPKLVKLSCNNTYVYALDVNNHAWFTTIEGSGKWKKFGNPHNTQFNWINASSNKKIYAIGVNNQIYETDIDGSTAWAALNNWDNSVMGSPKTISGEPDSDSFLVTNDSNKIYRHSPENSGGNWMDIKNENYSYGITELNKSNDNWKYLGHANNIKECRLKAVKDTSTEYSSIVYTTGNGGYDKTCYGGVKGGITNPKNVVGVTTSLAPNGSSRIGGEEGNILLNQLKTIQGEINTLIKQQSSETINPSTIGILKKERLTKNKEMGKMLSKLQQDRNNINKLLHEPYDVAGKEDASSRKYSNYAIYVLWLFIVIVSVSMAGHIYYTDSEGISPITYIFVGVWSLLFISYYYKQVVKIGESMWEYISNILVDNV